MEGGVLNKGISFQSVYFHYPSPDPSDPENPWLISDVRLHISPGTFVGLLGGNGSGKTTLLHLMNGLLQPSMGRVIVDGYDTQEPRHMKEVTRRVGIVFQNPDQQIVGSTVREEILFGMENLGFERSRMWMNLERVLVQTELCDYESRHPVFLSGGQKQRLAIAAILAMEPDYLLLDEPYSMLDPLGAMEIRSMLDTLRKELHCTVIVTSHEPEDLMFCDRILWMDHGRISLDMPPVEVFQTLDQMGSYHLGPYIHVSLEAIKENPAISAFMEPNELTESLKEKGR